MGYTYAQIRQLQDQYGMGHLSTNEFASMMNQTTGSSAFDAGTGGVGNMLKAASYGIDQGLNRTGAPQILGDFGESVAGDTGREVFSSIPRTAVNLAPSAIPGIGTAASAAMFGADTYEKTNSPFAGAVSALTMPLVGVGGKVGGQLASKLSRPALTDAIAGTSMGLVKGDAARGLIQGGVDALGKPVTALSEGGLIRDPGQRAVNYIGSKLGETFGLATQSGLTGAAAAPSGERWNAFTQAFEPAHLAADALSMVPFAFKDAAGRVFGGPGKAAAEAKFQSDYDNTLQKYNDVNWAPTRDATGQLANVINQKLALGLPEFSQVASDFNRPDEVASGQQKMTEAELLNQNIADVNKKTVRMTDEKGKVTDIRSSTLPLEGGVLKQPTLEEQVKTTWDATPDDKKLEVLSSPEIDTATKLDSAILENNSSREEARADAENLVKKGLPLDDAVDEVAKKQVVQAQDRVMKRTARQTREDATAQDRNAWLDSWMKTAPPEQKTTFEDALKRLSGADASPDATTTLTDSLRSWVADTNGQGDVASLQKKLEQGRQFTSKKTRDTKTRTPIGESDGENFVAADGKGKKIKYYTDQLEAKGVRDQLASTHKEFQWTVDPVGKGKWQILRYEWQQSSGQGEGKEASLTDKDLTDSLSEVKSDNAPFTQLEQDATRDEQKEAVDVVNETHQSSFVDTIPQDELSSLGDGDAQKGQVRIEKLFSLLDEGKQGPAAFLKGLKESGLFTNDQEARDFFGKAVPTIQDYVREKGKAFGDLTSTPEGQRVPLAEMLKRSGLTDPAHVAEATRLMSLFDNSDIAYGALKGGEGPQGLFTQTRDGQKAVWLAAALGPERAAFVLAHELNGHGLWSLLEQGKLDQESSNKMRRYADFVGENTPDQNKVLLREVLGMLPDRYKKDAGLQAMVESTSHDPEEVLANVNAAVSLAMVNAKPSALRSFMEWLPKPVGDFMSTAARYGRKIFEAISGVSFLRKFGVLPEASSLENQKQLHGYIDTLYKVLKYDGEGVERARQAAKLDVAMTPGMEMGALLDRTMFENPPTGEGDTIVKAFGLKKADDDPNKRTLLQKISSGYDKFLQPLVLIGQKFPQFLRATTRGQWREATNNRLENEWLKPLGLHNDGVKYSVDKVSPVVTVAKDPQMAQWRDNLQQRAQVMGKPVQELIDSKDGPTMEMLKRIPAGQQQTIREAILRQQDAHVASTKMYKDQSTERAIYQTAEVMMLKDSTLTSAQAQALAQQHVDNIQSGKPPVIASESDKVGAEFAQKVLDRVNQNVETMTSNPQYITSKRMGDYKFRVRYKNAADDTVIDAKSLGEQTALMQKMQQEKGDQIVDMTPIPLTKGSFDYRQAAVDTLLDQEKGMREQLTQTLVANGIKPDDAQAIADKYSAASELKKEMAARSLPTLSLKRNFKEGWEQLDMLDQQIEYQRMLTRGLTKGTADAEFNMLMRDPENLNHPEADNIRRGWELYKQPDPSSVQAINKFNYVKFLSLHFLNMAQDALYPWTGTLAPFMIGDGGGVVSSYARITKAAARLSAEKVSGKKLAPDEQAMLDRYREGNRGIATYSDEANNDVMAAINARRVAEGKEPYSIGQMFSQPLGQALVWSKGLHKHFTDFSAETSMLAAYDHFRTTQKMSPADAEKAAFDMVTSTIGGGKAGRAVGIWDSGKFKPLSAALTALGTFGFLQIGTWKNMAEKALGQVPGLSRTQKTNALKAFGAHSAAMFATAGIFGLPLVGAILATVDKLFGINSKEAVAGWLQDDTSDDHAVQQVALHGLINQFGGIDYASRGNVPGVLGLNPENGFSLDSLAGPTWSLLKDVFGSATALAQGRVGEAVTDLAPNNLKRSLQLYRDDWEFRKKDGSLVDQSADSEKGLYAVMGLKPARIASMQERDQWQRVDAAVDKDERRNWLDGVVDVLNTQGPSAAQQAIYQRVKDRPGESLGAVANAVAERAVDKSLPYDARKNAGSSERVNKVSDAPLPSYNEQQRLQAVQKIHSMIGVGLPASTSRWQTAAKVDQVRQSNPYLSYDEAMDVIKANAGVSGGGHGGGIGQLGPSLNLSGLGRFGGL